MTTPNTITRYDLHDLAHLTATFVGTDGVTPADPSTVTFLHLNASGAVATYLYGASAAGGSISRIATGAYAIDQTIAAVGSGFYRWEGTGGVQAAEEWGYICDKTKFTL